MILVCLLFKSNAVAPLMCWWETQTFKPSSCCQLLAERNVFTCREKIKPRGQTITKQTLMDAAALEKRSVLMVCFLRSVFQLPSICLSRKEFLGAALFPATPCFTFIQTLHTFTSGFLLPETRTIRWKAFCSCKPIFCWQKRETSPVYLPRPDFSDSSGSSVCIMSIK